MALRHKAKESQPTICNTREPRQPREPNGDIHVSIQHRKKKNSKSTQ